MAESVSSTGPARRSGMPWWLPWGALVLVLAVLLAVGARPEHRLSLDERTERVAETIQCPQCVQEGASMASSDAPISKAGRKKIHELLTAGQSPDQVRQYFVGVYGPNILLTPRRTGFDALVWVVPVAALVLGAGGLAFAFWRWRQAGPDDVSDDDRARVATALAAEEPGS